MWACQFQVWAREYCLSGGKSFLSPTTLSSYEFFSHAPRPDWSGQTLRSPKWLGIQISRIIRHPGAGLECKLLQESPWLSFRSWPLPRHCSSYEHLLSKHQSSSYLVTLVIRAGRNLCRGMQDKEGTALQFPYLLNWVCVYVYIYTPGICRNVYIHWTLNGHTLTGHRLARFTRIWRFLLQQQAFSNREQNNAYFHYFWEVPHS